MGIQEPPLEIPASQVPARAEPKGALHVPWGGAPGLGAPCQENLAGLVLITLLSARTQVFIMQATLA